MDEHLIDIEGRRSGWSASTSSIWKIAEHKLPVDEEHAFVPKRHRLPDGSFACQRKPHQIRKKKPPEPRAQALAKLQIVLNLSFDPP